MEEQKEIKQDYNPVPEEELIENKKNWLLIISGIVLILIIIGGGIFWWLQNSKVEQESQKENVVINKEVENNKHNDKIELDTSTTEYAYVPGIHFSAVCYLSGDGKGYLKYFFEGNQFTESITADLREVEEVGEAEEVEKVCKSILFDVDDEGYKYLRYLFITDNDGDGVNLFLEKMYSTSDESKDTNKNGIDDLEELIKFGINYEVVSSEVEEVALIKEKVINKEYVDLEELINKCHSFNSTTAHERCLFNIITLAKDISYCYEAKFEGWTSYMEQCLEHFNFSNMTAEDCIKRPISSGHRQCILTVSKNEKNLDACILFVQNEIDFYKLQNMEENELENYRRNISSGCKRDVMEYIDDIAVCENNKEFIEYNQEYKECLAYAAKNSGLDIKDIVPTEVLKPYMQEEDYNKVPDKLKEYVVSLEEKEILYGLVDCYKDGILISYKVYIKDETGEKYQVSEYFDKDGNKISEKRDCSAGSYIILY